MKKVKAPPSPKQPDDALAAVLAMRALADKLEQKAVIEAIKQGWTWSRIAEALAVSKQAAHKKYAAIIKKYDVKKIK